MFRLWRKKLLANCFITYVALIQLRGIEPQLFKTAVNKCIFKHKINKIMKYEIEKNRIEKIIINEETGEITIYKDFGGATSGLRCFSFKVIDLKISKLDIPDESPEKRINIYRQSSE